MTETTAFERAFPLEGISIRAGGEGRTVEAYIGVFNRTAEIDDFDGHYWETIRPGAFAKSIREGRGSIVPLFNHAKTVQGVPAERYSMPLGAPVWDEWREDSRGLLTVTRYSNTPLADEVLELIRDGALSGHSFGGRFIRSNLIQPTRPGDLPTIERLEIALREYGPAPFPSYKDAKVVGVRSVPRYQNLPLAPRDRAWDRRAADRRWRALSDSGDEPSDSYWRAFLWWDVPNREDFGAYKLPIGDVVDGRLVAVPRGVFAAAARLEGTDIPDADKERVRSQLARYYAKMREEFDDDSLVPPWERAVPLVRTIARSIEELSPEERTALAGLIAPGTPAGAAPPGTPAPAPPEEPGTQPPAAPAGTEGAAPSVDALALAQAQRRRRLAVG
jgi:HK97 family phage prohead protease